MAEDDGRSRNGVVLGLDPVTSHQIDRRKHPIEGFRMIGHGDRVFRTLFGLSRTAFWWPPSLLSENKCFPTRRRAVVSPLAHRKPRHDAHSPPGLYQIQERVRAVHRSDFKNVPTPSTPLLSSTRSVSLPTTAMSALPRKKSTSRFSFTPKPTARGNDVAARARAR
jgi:hypothetical protein